LAVRLKLDLPGARHQLAFDYGHDLIEPVFYDSKPALGCVRPFGFRRSSRFGLPDAVVGRIQISMGVVPGGLQRGLEIADAAFCRLPERGRRTNVLDRPGDFVISICGVPRAVLSLNNCKPKGFTNSA
jgi:hypothetical protein